MVSLMGSADYDEPQPSTAHRVVVAVVLLLAGCLASGCALGPSYHPEGGPRLTDSEAALFHYDNDLEFVCDPPKYKRDRDKARAEARQLERLVQAKPNHLFRMQVASSDEPGDLDEDVTVREYAGLGLKVLRERASRKSGRKQCFKRYAASLANAMVTPR
jgi:hypothetical protein